jgi:hypothetical protein
MYLFATERAVNMEMKSRKDLYKLMATKARNFKVNLKEPFL